MMSVVRIFCILSVVCGFNFGSAIAQVADQKPQMTPVNIGQDIGGGLYLVTVPAVYETVPETVVVKEPDFEWIIIPATYETITETVIVQPSRTTLKIIPPVKDEFEELKISARAKLVTIPAVTKEVTRRIVKTPARPEKRFLPSLCNLHNHSKRVLQTPEFYKITDAFGNIVGEYETHEKLAGFLNAREP